MINPKCEIRIPDSLGGGGRGRAGIDTPTLTMCFCELLRQVTNHCSERGRLMAHIWTSMTRQLAESETVAQMGARIAQLDHEVRRSAAVLGARLETSNQLVSKLAATLDAVVPHWRNYNADGNGLPAALSLALPASTPSTAAAAVEDKSRDTPTASSVGGENREDLLETPPIGKKKPGPGQRPEGNPSSTTAAILGRVAIVKREGLGLRTSMGPLVSALAILPVHVPIVALDEEEKSATMFGRRHKGQTSRGLENGIESQRAANSKKPSEMAADACLRADLTRLAAGIGMQVMEATTVERMVEERVGAERRKLAAEIDKLKLEKKKLAEKVAGTEALHLRIKDLNGKVSALEVDLADARAMAIKAKESHAREIAELKETLDGDLELERERARRAIAAAAAGGSAESAAVIATHETIRGLNAALRTLAKSSAHDATRKLARLGVHSGEADGADVAGVVLRDSAQEGDSAFRHVASSSSDVQGLVHYLPPPDIRVIVREAAAARMLEAAVVAASANAKDAAAAAAAVAAVEAAAPSPWNIDAAAAVRDISEEELVRRWANWTIAHSGTAWTREMSSIVEGLAAAYPLAVIAHALCPEEMPALALDQLLSELDSKVVAGAALAALAAGAGAPETVVTSAEVTAGDSEDLSLAYLGHVFASKPGGPTWPAAEMGQGTNTAAYTAANTGGRARAGVGAITVHQALLAAKELGKGTRVGRLSRRKAVEAVLRSATANIGIAINELGAPITTVHDPDAVQTLGISEKLPRTGTRTVSIPCPSTSSLSAASNAIRTALDTIEEVPDPKGAIGKAAATALRAESLEEAEDLLAFAPHVAALHVAIAAAEADAADAAGVYHVASRRVLKHALEMMASRSHGEIVQLDTSQRRSDMSAYTVLQRHKMREVFASDAECEEQLAALSVVLSDLFKRIQAIYAHYSGGAQMSTHGFWAMVRDCRLVTKRLTPQRIDILFIRVNVDNRDEEGVTSDFDKTLSPGEFIEALVRMAQQRGTEGTLTSRFEAMMYDVIIPNACQSNSDEFRALLSAPQVREVFARHHAALRAIFTHFAAADFKGGREKLVSISLEEYLMLINKAELVSILSVVQCRRIFAASQIDDDISEMVFAEFTESIGALAQHADPNPYVPISIRLDQFLSRVLIPNLLKSDANIKVRLQGTYTGCTSKESRVYSKGCIPIGYTYLIYTGRTIKESRVFDHGQRAIGFKV